MREEHRLRMLQVRAARHDRAARRLGLRGQGVDEPHEHRVDHRGVVAEVHADERRDLVVAAAARAELPAELGARDVHEAALEGAVHVLVGLGRDERARAHAVLEGVERLQHGLPLGL
ncbi:hypothetical protein CMMCAS03_01150 [Clavibacter michiganensis subsp. michiganensis]|nr:hypothetical protein CMMCAS03_01150 [Clavibacter michiganensis subsp. michiganensis]